MDGQKAKPLKRLVGARGFEPRTSCAQGRRATRLRYAPTLCAASILGHMPTCLPLQSKPGNIALGTQAGTLDQESEQRLSGPVEDGQESGRALQDLGGSQEALAAGGILQAQERLA